MDKPGVAWLATWARGPPARGLAGAAVAVLNTYKKNFSKKIYIVGGNADSYYVTDAKKFKNLVYAEDKLEFKIDNQKIDNCYC